MERVEIGSRLCVCLVWAAKLVPADNEDGFSERLMELKMSLMPRRISSRPTNILALRQRENLQRCIMGYPDLKSEVQHNHLEKLRSETSSTNWCPLWRSELQMCASDGADIWLCWKNKDRRRPFSVVGPLLIYLRQALVRASLNTAKCRCFDWQKCNPATFFVSSTCGSYGLNLLRVVKTITSRNFWTRWSLMQQEKLVTVKITWIAGH